MSVVLQNNEPTPTICGVKVLTWGTSPEAGNGVLHIVDSTFFGGSVGHAAVMVTFPNNLKGQELMEKCQKNNIPVELKTVKHYNNKGEEVSEEVIQVYWSWWPSPIYLQKNMEADQKSLRIGENFDFDLEKIERLNLTMPEQRRHSGPLGSRVMSYGPKQLLHARNLDEEKIAYLEAKRQADLEDEEEKTIKILETKLQVKSKLFQKKSLFQKLFRKKSLIELGITEQLILNKYAPEWKNVIKNPNKVNEEEFDRLIELKDKAKRKIQNIGDLARFYSKHNMLVELLKDHLNDSHFVITENVKKCFALVANTNVRTKEISELKVGHVLNLDFLKEWFERSNNIIKTAMENPEIANIIRARNLEKAIDFLNNNLNKSTPIKLNNEILASFKPFIPDLENFVDNSLEISPEKIKILYTMAKEAFDKVKDDIILFRYDLLHADKIMDEENNKNYITEGLLPSNVVSLPIYQMERGQGSVGLENGLNVERMIDKMVELSDRNEIFELRRKNCSKTTDSILEAGAQTANQKNFFQNHAFGFLGNPQESYQNALAFQADFFQGGKGEARRFKNPIEILGGKILDTWTDPKASILKTTVATLGSLVVLPLALASFAIRKVLNPLQTFKDLYGLIKFSFSRNSITLKVISLIIQAPVMTVLSPFAAVQYGIKKAIVDPIRSLTKTSNQTYARLESEMKEEQLDKLSDVEKQKNIDLKNRQQEQDQSLKAVMDMLTVNINADPKNAIDKFKEALEANPGKIILFKKESADKITQYMHNHPEEKIKLDQLMKEQAVKLNQVVKNFKAEKKSNPPK